MSKKKGKETVATDTNFQQEVQQNEVSEETRLQAEVDYYKDIAARIQAEFENYKRRNNESVKLAKEDGIIEVAVNLFSVVDAIERASKLITDPKTAEGVNLIHKKMTSLLQRYEIEECNPEGEIFDPNFHNAVMRVEDAENSGKVVEVLQKGYKLRNKIVRYAMVKVAD
jgi:molecular chaperone GrpE